MYGDNHRGKLTFTYQTCERTAKCLTVRLGSALLLGGILDLHSALPPASIADNCLYEPFVWRYAVLCDELV